MITDSLTAESATALVDFLATLETSPAAHTCNRCGARNAIVNQCGCDPNNLPTPCPRFTVGQRLEGTTWPRLNKRCTLAEYRAETERYTETCEVQKVMVLSRAEWAELAESLLSNRADLGTGGHNSGADLPDGWEYEHSTEEERKAFAAQAYRLVTVVCVAGAADDSDTFLVDAQGYRYARYVGFLAGAKVLPKVERPQLPLVPPPAEVEQVPEVPAWADMAMDVPETIRSIEAAQLPAAPVNSKARSAGQKERTAMIRKALKAAGVRGVSVTMATGSMCYWTHVRAEGISHPEGTDWNRHEGRDCPVCQRNQAADKKLTALILAAFPDLGDRSDLQSDHFDFVFTVSVNGR